MLPSAPHRTPVPSIPPSAAAAGPQPIVAIATAPGRGAIGIVRLSGQHLEPVIAALLGQEAAARLQPRCALYCSFLAADGAELDRGLALWFPAPHSYTGESVLELQGHGGPVLLRSLLARCLQAGASAGLRLAEPGEFTRRAFLNDRMDLAQAEAVADLIDAASGAAARSAVRSLAGEFSRAVMALIERLIDLRLRLEAAIDFPEEDIEQMATMQAREGLQRLRARLADVRQRASQGARLREGLRVVLVGAPNVGKSSLLNALAGEDVAIVTAVPGTTRDRIVQAIELEGLAVQIIDTAGLRPTADEVERIGIARTLEAVAQADAVLHVLDASRAAPACGNEAAGLAGAGPVADEDDADRAVLAQIEAHRAAAAPRITVLNKIDLLPGKGAGARSAAAERPAADVAPARHAEAFLRVSARTGEGLDPLRQALLAVAGWQGGNEAETVFLARERHLQALAAADTLLAAAAAQAGLPRPALELLAEDLRLAQDALAAIGGEFTADDLLGRIFSHFCIGK